MNKTLSNEAVLIADLNATFHGCGATSLRQWSGNPLQIGAVVGGESGVVEGEPIAPYIYPESTAYDGWVHGAFSEWVRQRGWYVEVYEPGTLWVVPIPTEGGIDA